MKDLKHSGRRAFLKMASGAAVALPLLEFTHGKAWADENTQKRFLTVFSHGGTVTNQDHAKLHDGTGNFLNVDHWKPTGPGESLKLGAIHQELEPWVEKLLVLRGVNNGAADVQAQYGSGGHGISNVTALTAADAEEVDDSVTSLGPSIDQVLADRLSLANPVKFPRVHLKINGHQYGSPYFAGSKQGLSGEKSPADAFAQIFEGVSADPEPDPALVRRNMIRGSVLGGAVAAFGRFRKLLSQTDRYAVDAHLEHLHALEEELAIPVPICQPPDGIDADKNAEGNIVGPQHVKIILAALRCGLTHVANLEISDIVTPWTPAGLQVESAFNIGHSLGHMASDMGPTGEAPHLAEKWLAEIIDNRRWRMSLVKQLLEGLDDPDFSEGGKTMLDNSLLLFTSEFSNAPRHASAGIPLLLAGSAGGYFKTGRHLNYNKFASTETTEFKYETDESTHNLFTSILQAFGGTDSHFGNGDATHQGPLPGLT